MSLVAFVSRFRIPAIAFAIAAHFSASPLGEFASAAEPSSAASIPGQSEPLNYQKDVQPILADHCAQCHGIDANTRQGGLRLDIRDMALKGGESGQPALVPGNPGASELIHRIQSTNPDEVMPPPDAKKPLTTSQKEILAKWIQEGATYESHWAFVPPQKQPIPKEASHPVDAIVESRLHAKNLALAPPAPAPVLCRRLYLDLLGLPPSPAEVSDFHHRGFAATLETLLNSERFGEKWARHWLDAARYSDTNGYEKDLRREQWKWRDWVVDAWNRDMPYNQFIIEQIAGDLLPDATQDQVIATGFLRNSMINEEGAIVAEQFRMVEMFDRMDCLGKAILGLSTQCAQCHSHKFDPLTQDEYYGMFACLNNTYEAQSWVYTPEQQKQIQDIHTRIAAVEQRLREGTPSWPHRMQEWETELQGKLPEWIPLLATELGSVSGLNHPTQEFDRSLLMQGHPSDEIFMISQPDLTGVTGLQIEVLPHGDLPFRGPGRSRTGMWGITELEVLVKKPDSNNWEAITRKSATADYSEPEKKQDDGKIVSGPVQLMIDGSTDTAWRADRGAGRRNQASAAVIQFEKPLDFPATTQIKVVLRMRDMVGCCRISLTRNPNPTVPPIPHEATLALRVKAAERSPSQQAILFSAWRSQQADLAPLNQEIEQAWSLFPEAPTSVLHLAERAPTQTRKTHSLHRGNWDQPQQEIQPHTPVALHPMPSSNEPARLRFARWLADDRSPLTARVAVNRIWQAIFGEGLVETSEDFGTRAPLPEHRELLDWLAVDFMEHGWSHKHLLRTILTSRVYQQDSRATPQSLDQDPRNRWLARGPRFRTEAEVMRDIALSVSGLITHRLGGAGIIPPVPQNVLDYNFVYPDYWKPTGGADRYRRALYVLRKRSMPDPVLTTLDAPNGDFACARRIRSNTPLAALTCLNEPIFVEAAQALALRVLREGGADDHTRIDYAFQLCLARSPSEQEKEAIFRLMESRRRRIAEGWLNVRDITTGDPAKLPSLPDRVTPQDAAAWTIASRVLLNLDETVTKN